MLDRAGGAWIPAVAAKENSFLQCTRGGRSTAQHSTAQLGAVQYDRDQHEQHSTTHSKTITEHGNIFLHADLGLRRWEGEAWSERGHVIAPLPQPKKTHTEHRQSIEWEEEKQREIKMGPWAYRSVGIVDWSKQTSARRSPRYISSLESVMQTSDRYNTRQN